ncbi:hypothetical protein TNCV_698411 [Trichonephila clavipes]|nr:hypothetical protein TNCV_698411 [Trichonephila clavipes]
MAGGSSLILLFTSHPQSSPRSHRVTNTHCTVGVLAFPNEFFKVTLVSRETCERKLPWRSDIVFCPSRKLLHQLFQDVLFKQYAPYTATVRRLVPVLNSPPAIRNRTTARSSEIDVSLMWYDFTFD